MNKENIVNTISHLFKSGYISIRVDITTEHAKCGNGKWNKTPTVKHHTIYLVIANQYGSIENLNLNPWFKEES